MRATVALSPSPTAWEFLNHASPRNLLLMFGADDVIVPPEGRAMLIGAATRGYLDGPGRMGVFARGSARQLIVVPRAGHVDILYTDAARVATLEWLRPALGLAGPVRLSRFRFGWLAAGLAALQVCFWWPRGQHPRRPVDSPPPTARSDPRLRPTVVAAAVWGASLGIAPWVSGAMPELPAQETRSLGSLLVSIAGLLSFALLVVARFRSRPISTPRAHSGTNSLSGVGRGLTYALLMWASIHVLCWNLVACPTDGTRLALWAFYAMLALPFFAALDAIAGSISDSRPMFASVLALAAVFLVLGAPLLAARMGVLPVYLLAATIFMLVLSLLGGISSSWGLLGRAVFGALFLGRAIAVTCPLY